jgi:hypothetical protein
VKKQRKFDYNYYLSKNCPMPEEWPNQKENLEVMAKDPKQRGQVYATLFDADSKYR